MDDIISAIKHRRESMARPIIVVPGTAISGNITLANALQFLKDG